VATIAFPHKLVLNRYLLSFFGADPHDSDSDLFREISKRLTDESLEIRREDGTSPFNDELIRLLPENSMLTEEQLLEFDENIARDTLRINKNRTIKIRWKYFQYLSLLFSEIYLDRYFQDKETLLNELNGFLDKFNETLKSWGERDRDLISSFTESSLSKLAFWNATGSGKTLLMHVNMLQYLHYLKKYKRSHELNRIVVLTPNEGLTKQHLEEFRISGISATAFDKNASDVRPDMFTGQIVDVIDMNKLREEGKQKTVSVDQFEKNNLVLIDEGHRGARGDVWSEMRTRLAEEGFTFEYSATLGQAASSDVKLTDEYAKTIIFDYSYRYFHADGFGKDYQILNVEGIEQSQADKENRHLYLTACLLTYQQQLRLYEDKKGDYKPLDIDKPLWVFVGSKVTAIRTENRCKVSDVVDILLFLAELVENKTKTIANLNKLLSGDTGLLDNDNKDIFSNAFIYLVELSLSADELLKDIYTNLFNAPNGGSLHVDYLKGGDGELALRLGSSDSPFGVVNVGDAKALAALCDEHEELHVMEKSFSSSMFQSINHPDSHVNILIGSKRFAEGWNSYRVSTLGLMYVGQKEGSEIIQLFGRGVRLRGYEHCLKRSRAIHWDAKEDELSWVGKDHLLPILETLNVFGVKSDYMAKFNDFLEGEGIKKPDDRIPIKIPVTFKLPSKPLITVKVPDEINFKREAKATLSLPEEIQLPHASIVLDWYPRVDARASDGVKYTKHSTHLNTAKLEEQHLAFMNINSVYLQLQQMKSERSWHNFNLSLDTVNQLLIYPNNQWYTLYVPEQTMKFEHFEQVREWEEIAVVLLKKYCDRFYKAKKNAYESPHRIYHSIAPNDPNFFDEYNIFIDRSEKLIIQRLNELKQRIEDGLLEDFSLGGKAEALFFEKHLYMPLLHLKQGVDIDLFKVSPVHLNEGEKDFVVDLRNFYLSNPELLQGRETYLLRNQSRGRGVGFFEAGNFYPDFILWILEKGIQHIVFVDPKGILRCEGFKDPKLKFYTTIKDIEKKLEEQSEKIKSKVILHSFVLSNTPIGKIRWWNPEEATLDDLAKRHVLFQHEDKKNYINTMFNKIVN
jgi:type III restriction/modification enzyme restriction subunit